MRSNPSFEYTNHVKIVPKISLIFRKIPKKFLKFCKNTPKLIPKILLISVRHPVFIFYRILRHTELKDNSELVIAAISLFQMSQWSRHIINMLLYKDGEILPLVSITVTLCKLVS